MGRPDRVRGRRASAIRWAVGIGWVGSWLGLALALPVAAEGPDKVEIKVTVAQISDRPGAIDPRGRRLHDQLKKQFRYQSLRVLDTRNLSLALDQVGSMRLPNDRSFAVRPMDVGANGVLLAVSVGGLTDTDLRVRRNHLVVFGAERFEDGKLVISLEPDW